jgi:hypothetical protein
MSIDMDISDDYSMSDDSCNLFDSSISSNSTVTDNSSIIIASDDDNIHGNLDIVTHELVDKIDLITIITTINIITTMQMATTALSIIDLLTLHLKNFYKISYVETWVWRQY